MYALEPLFEKVEDYAKTSFELYRLKTIQKSTNIISVFISRGIVIVFFFMFITAVNIGAALWLGDILGKDYYGFFCVAGFYGILGTIVYSFMHKYIKSRVSNAIISQLLN